mmetsp:Transcript_8889/g.11912  ORF Transcript_8889/g.11912 Transcript_8889/m.11912 type:complete len:201 (-) Transcript_8889:112-714(-)
MLVSFFIFVVVTVLCGVVTAKDERQLTASIDSTACLEGFQVCDNVGKYGSGNIEAGACDGAHACFYAGYGGHVTVGSNSCQQKGACYDLGKQGDATIGSESCKGEYACMDLGENGRRIEIGSNSCNCDNCCRCLKGDIHAVPDNSCNVLGAEECCKSSTEKGSKASATLPPTESPKAAPNAAPTSSKKYSLKLISIAISD